MRIRVCFCEEYDPRIIQAANKLENQDWLDVAFISNSDVDAISAETWSKINPHSEPIITAYQERSYLAGLAKLHSQEIDILIAGASIALNQFREWARHY